MEPGSESFFLTSGHLRAPGFAFAARPLKSLLGGLRLTNTVAVHVRADGNLVLVDAGFSAAILDDPQGTLGRAQARVLGVVADERRSVAEQLDALGFSRDRVRTVIATHLHRDHISGALDFPDAELICDARELDAFRTRRDPGYDPRDLERGGRLRPIALNGPPRQCLPASHDVFGDGSVVLLDAHGHTAGSLAVHLRDGDDDPGYLHIGDAAYRSWEYLGEKLAPSLLARVTAHDRRALQRTHQLLRACSRAPSPPVIVPSHDEQVFAQLPHAATPRTT